MICNFDALIQVGASISSKICTKDVICLSGDLGAGKTALAGSIIKPILICDQHISSPTFNLVNTYQTHKGIVWHFDLYRVNNIDEMYELGIEEALSSGISIIEWPKMASSIIPKDALYIDLNFIEDSSLRQLSFSRPFV